MKFLRTALMLLLAAGVHNVYAQTADSVSSKYDQTKVFIPLFYPQTGNEYRTANGAPGPKYWQNRADYKLNVTLDTAADV